MKKHFTCLVIFFIFSAFLYCYELTSISEFEPKFAAQQWLYYINKIPFENKAVEYKTSDIALVMHNGKVLCEIYHLSPRGHILVTGYKEFVPIKSFSLESDFDTESRGYEYAVLEELKAQAEFMDSYNEGSLEGDYNALKNNVDKWNKTMQIDLTQAVLFEIASSAWEIEKGIKKFILKDSQGLEVAATKASPLLTTKWSQGKPFWNGCPYQWNSYDLKWQRCFVGCTATAMAQIMRYYKYPSQGEGSHTYYWAGIWLNANFSDNGLPPKKCTP